MIVDFRKQLDGPIVIIVDALDKDPSSGDLFIFRNRSGNKLKCVYFDGRCFWAKRNKTDKLLILSKGKVILCLVVLWRYSSF